MIKSRASPNRLFMFCAESENLLENAQKKLKNKGCDYLVANDISKKDIGFYADYNEVTIFSKDGRKTQLEKAPKIVIAKQILDWIVNEQV